MQRIAFFGGSFDPPHRGHLAIAKAAADRFALDQVLFAPVAAQPLKRSATPFLHRYTMTVLATQADARFIPSLLDAPQAESQGPNYTVDTLVRLRSAFAEEIELFTLLGADSWLNIARWHEASHLLAQSDWIVAARPGFLLAAAAQALPPGITAEQDAAQATLLLRHPGSRVTRVFFLRETHEDISASALRNATNPDLTLIPAAVGDYIRKTELYRGC